MIPVNYSKKIESKKNNNSELLFCYEVLFLNNMDIKYQNSNDILKVKQKQKIK